MKMIKIVFKKQKMFAHIYGESIRMDELYFFTMVLTEETDYLLKKDSIARYQVINQELVLKKEESESEEDAIHFQMRIEDYISRYPQRHGYTNLLNCEFPSFKRTSMNYDS